ncbi:aldehyde dehydrogenase family protein [Undibacterium sp. Ji67W]|uniref:aldehyde dehydrogenase family protein n=1 Tax=Undibacterium sp. Ji67W TaxID=3413042 RepID=UPI003BF07FE6
MRNSNQNSTSKRYQGYTQQYIGGQWRDGQSKDSRIIDTNPYDGKELVVIRGASVADVNDAYTSALAAQPAWEATSPRERAAIMRRAADILLARRDEIIDLTIQETGGIRKFAEIIWYFAWSITDASASYPALVKGGILQSDVPNQESMYYRKALGVVTVISPWNSPINLTQRSLAPALALGNTVVLKPASDTPITGGLIHAKVFAEAGLPPDVLNVVVGSSSEIGDAVIKHPVSNLVSFTGSTSVGRSLLGKVGESPMLKRLALELGGNAPFVVLDDADLDAAVQALVVGRFLHQGQICMSANRAIVVASVHDAFVDKLVERIKSLPSGDPQHADTVIGPLINNAQVKSVLAKIEKAKSEGLHMILGGDVFGAMANIIPPHVFVDVASHHALAREESFGPVLPILKARDEAHALELANDTEFGLSSAVFTKDLERGRRFILQVKAGMGHVNDIPIADSEYAPFGGERNSGIGRFNSDWIVDEYTRTHWITTQRTRAELPF